MRLAGHPRSRHRRLPQRGDPVQRQPDRSGRPQPRRIGRRDDRRRRQDRDARPRQRPHAHLGDGAARHRLRVAVGGLFQARPRQPGDPLQRGGQLRRQPDRRAGADRRRRHHAGRLVPQHHVARHGRARDRRPRRQRHPRRVRARHRQADRPDRRHAVHPRPASARPRRASAQGPARQRRRPHHARDGDPRSRLGQLGSGRARHPHGARVRPGIVVAHPAARGLRRSRRLSPHGRGRVCSVPTTTWCTAPPIRMPICGSWSTAVRR